MAKDLNKVQLTGRLGADPDMRQTQQGHTVTTFRVASNRSWRSSDGETHEETEWFRIVAWNRLAEICNQFLAKGARVYVEGRLQTRQWQDQDGQPRFVSEVIASDMIILDRREQPGASQPDDVLDDVPIEHTSISTAPPPPRPARVASMAHTKAPLDDDQLSF